MKKILANLLILLLPLTIFLQAINYQHFVLNSSIIDNTNHGWEVKRNNNHKQPDIPPGQRDIISKYNAVYAGDPDKKVIYLTIDLGYESGNTEAILDVLKSKNIKATFFIISSYLQKNAEIVDRIVNEGHSLENHTANYLHLNNLMEYQVKNEIMDLHNIILKKYGISMKYLRLPYEDWSEKVLKVANDTGYKTVFWSIACVDWVENKDTAYIYNSIINNHHNGAVILMHAISKDSPEAIEMITRDLIIKGYEFKALDM